MGETIVMVHGMWGGSWCWENYVPFFEERGHRCLVPTLRFHDTNPGDPPDPRLGTTSLLDYAEDLEGEIRRLEERPVVMGHSMGGLLAQMLGARGLAKALVLLTPASPAGIMALTPSVVRCFWSIEKTWGFWRKPIRQTYEEAVYAVFHLMPPEEARRTFDRFGYESGRAAFEIGFWLLDSRKASRVDESKVTCPVLVISGREDRIVPAPVVRKVAKKYESVATYKEFDHHAHWVLGQPGWEEVAEYAARWIEIPPSSTEGGGSAAGEGTGEKQ